MATTKNSTGQQNMNDQNNGNSKTGSGNMDDKKQKEAANKGNRSSQGNSQHR